ncbi:MAG: hypothetical protein PHR44_00565 [Candidatus Omnitrophica bacterium]|nr:hypothetical protein [Candidatus Omnitrophota bacterium]
MKFNPLKAAASFLRSAYSSFTGILVELGLGVSIIILGFAISMAIFFFIAKLT